MTHFTPERIAELRALHAKRSMDALVSSDFSEYIADCERSYYLAAGDALPAAMDEIERLREALENVLCTLTASVSIISDEDVIKWAIEIAREALR